MSFDTTNAIRGGLTPMVNAAVDSANGRDPFAGLKETFSKYDGGLFGFAFSLLKQGVGQTIDDISYGGHRRSEVLYGFLGFSSTPGYGVSAAISSRFKRFFSVQGSRGFARMFSGGTPWPNISNKAHLGIGLYLWESATDAKNYQKIFNGRNISTKILNFDISLSKLKKLKTMDLTKLSDLEVDNFLGKYSSLYGEGLSHNFDRVMRKTGNFGVENYFHKSTFKSFNIH